VEEEEEDMMMMMMMMMMMIDDDDDDYEDWFNSNHGSSVDKMAGYMLDGPQTTIFLTTDLVPSLPPIQQLSGALSAV
jgi:ATP-dependent phosphoenolpyruvate carboxykinase